MSKKLEKEAFVQQLSGTTVAEVILISLLQPLLLLALQLIAFTSKSKHDVWNFCREFLVLVVPTVYQLMGPPSPPSLLAWTAGIVAILIGLNAKTLRHQRSKMPLMHIHGALSAHRAFVMIITCISILAVDFHAFPRRFAKAEAFGTGLMDAGVGCIVVSTAFSTGMKGVARKFHRTKPGGRRRDTVRLIVLLTLGLGRSIAIYLAKYQLPVGEYGQHWNFFITLAALRGFLMLLPRNISGSSTACGLIGMILLVIHQTLLSRGGWIDYIHASDRGSSLFSANKEGIFSLPGYIGLHLLGCACGALLEEIAGPTSSRKGGHQRRVLSIIASLWAAFYACNRYIQPVSRRSCNVTYIFWILGFNVQILALLSLVTACLPTQQLPRLLHAVSDTMLPTFLIANLLTGAVNMSLDTMSIGDSAARLIVLLYIGAVCGASFVVNGWATSGPAVRKWR